MEISDFFSRLPLVVYLTNFKPISKADSIALPDGDPLYLLREPSL